MTHVRSRAALVAAMLLLTACGADTDGDSAPADDATEDVGATDPDEQTDPDEAMDADEVTLRLLTHDSFDVSEEVLDEFTVQTGIQVQVIPSGDAGTALNQAILTKDAPQGDLLFGVDTTFLSRALDEDLFVPYRSEELDRVPDELHVDGDAATAIDVGDVCLNYDVAAFDDGDLELPTSLEDLRSEQMAGSLVVQNPATSSPGLAFVYATVQEFGEDGWLDFWADLRDGGVVVTDGWSEAYYDEFSGPGQGGDRPLVVSYASSPAAEVVYADPPTDTAPTGVIEASCVRQVEYVGVLAGTEHESEAQQLVDFLLSRTFQEDVPLTMFVYPVVDDAELPDVFEQHARLPSDPYVLDPMELGATRDEVIEQWTEVVLR